MNKPIITVKDLNLWYGQTQALKHINIDIPEKSITALIGPSGCGKSTFLKTLNRMNDLIPSVKIAGEVAYNGQNIFDTDVNNLRKEVGMVFQKPNPFPMSIYDNIAYGPRTHGITNKAQLDDIVDYCLRSGIDGIVAGNTTRSRDGLTISKEEIEKIGNGGMSGAPVHKKNLELVRYIHSKTEGKLPIIGVGGIMSEENAKAMIDAGASLVEIYSGFIYEGPALIKRIIRHLEKK